LPAKANPEYGLVARYGISHPVQFGLQPVSDARVIPCTPGGSERNNEVVVVEVGKGEFNVRILESLFRNYEHFFDLVTVMA
jgi:hypothetical protein